MAITPAVAQVPVQLRFMGQTLADQILLRDILRNILLFGNAKFGCSSIELVESEILDRNFDPGRNIAGTMAAQKSYERWQTTLCGKKEVFLISHWSAAQGGTDFAVTYPFPDQPRNSN
jgi:hypothetical protein